MAFNPVSVVVRAVLSWRHMRPVAGLASGHAVLLYKQGDVLHLQSCCRCSLMRYAGQPAQQCVVCYGRLVKGSDARVCVVFLKPYIAYARCRPTRCW